MKKQAAGSRQQSVSFLAGTSEVGLNSRKKAQKPQKRTLLFVLFRSYFRILRQFPRTPPRPAACCLLPALLLVLFSQTAGAQSKRLVVIKVDGLPYSEVDRFARERDPRTGKSLLPWFEEVFYRNGARFPNFYTRGMSLSGPAWSLLDTGQHLQVKGNVEFDRLTLHSYDYLNFVPFYINNAKSERVDMPGVEVLDELRQPLLLDAFPYEQRLQGFQLYQRGIRWSSLQRAFTEKGKQDPSDLVSEWALGISGRSLVQNQMERDLIAKLKDPNVRYLDYYETQFDHAAHHNRDRESHLVALQDLDALIGRVWMEIQKSPLADDTVLTIVSDHGFNSDPKIYSQGYNLVKLLGSAEGGGHHVITKRRLLLDYSLKGVYPLVPLITTTTPDSYYLKGQSTDYPTALLDFDGNERAAIHLRDSDLNALHILLQQLQQKGLKTERRGALIDAFFQTLDRRRPEWQKLLDELREELDNLREDALSLGNRLNTQPKPVWTKRDLDTGADKEARRVWARWDMMRKDLADYDEYSKTLANLLSLNRENFRPEKWRIPDLIAKQSAGTANSLYNLQNYVAGLGPDGLVFDADGAFNPQRSFKRLDYLELLATRAVRNNVQPGVVSRPVDFVALRLPAANFGPSLDEFGQLDGQVVWLYGGAERQALILSRTDAGGELNLRYLPVSQLKQNAAGAISFTRAAWQKDFPLRIWEDPNFAAANREEYLNQWHTGAEWLNALHRTVYSNGLIGLHEQLTRHTTPATDADAPNLERGELLRRRFLRRQRELAETDLLVLANNHWNFDVRGFNPGGNHGSFFRVSTNATLMFAGGANTGIPRNRVIETPYDSLSFAPTLLNLAGELEAATGQPSPALRQRGFPNFPGPVIKELAGPQNSPPKRAGAR
jgi:hypothetical protein